MRIRKLVIKIQHRADIEPLNTGIGVIKVGIDVERDDVNNIRSAL